MGGSVASGAAAPAMMFPPRSRKNEDIRGCMAARTAHSKDRIFCIHRLLRCVLILFDLSVVVIRPRRSCDAYLMPSLLFCLLHLSSRSSVICVHMAHSKD